MVTVLNHNSIELLQYLKHNFNNFENNLYLKYQLKTMIFLYLTNKHEAYIDQHYYKNSLLCILFCKYVRYLKHQMFCFTHMISANKEIVYIDTTNIIPPQVFNFYQKSKNNENITKDIRNSKTVLKKEDIRKIIIDFMRPYNNLKTPVSNIINELILDTLNYEKEKKTMVQN